jgi:TorA maturation chaperone TorD
MINVEMRRKDIYQYLAKLYQVPDSDTYQHLDGFLSNLSAISGENQKDPMREELDLSAANHQSLIVEYSKLFIGPYKVKAPPFGSIYLDGKNLIMGDSTLDVIHRYREMGLDMAGDFNNPPDHIIAEFEFMVVLVSRMIIAHEEGDNEELLAMIDAQLSFLVNHLNEWVPQFVERVGQNAEHNFYPTISRAALNFIQEDLVYLMKAREEIFTKIS